MASSPVSSITPPSPPSNSSTPTAPSPSIQPNGTSATPPFTQPNGTSATPPQSTPPPPLHLQSPPPSPPLTPPPILSPPTPPSSTSSPPRVLSPPPPSILSPPLKISPPPPSKVSPPLKVSPPPPSKLSPPLKLSPPPQPPPLDISSPPPPLDFLPPPPPEDNSTTPLLSPTTSPLPPIATSSPPTPVSFALPTNSSTNGTFSPSLDSFPTPGTKDTDSGMSPKGGGMKPGTAAAVGVVFGFLALSVVLIAVWFVRRRKRRNGSGGYVMPSPFASSRDSDSSFMRPQKSPKLAQNGSGTNFMYSSDPNSKSWFTYEELSDATQGFSAKKLLGEGGFGCVYKGLLVDGREVAVKQLKIGGGQGEREFRAEVDIISRVHHRYLVLLVGYCISDHQRLLVYEYLPNNTLHYHLHGEGTPVMEWSTRVQVASGAARGIAYLHEDCQPRIIHRDIKSSNILLDNNFDARVADFGLAKLAADANTHVTTRVMGTFGYMAPEYASSGKLTEKSDVFSYGVVLLELITGRKPVDGSQPLGNESLVEWARPLLSEALEKEKFKDLIDPRLENNYVELEMFRMIKAAAACIRHSAPKRPKMSQVVRAFDSLNEYPDSTNGMKLGQSKIYNSREQSAQIKIFQRMAFGSQDFGSGYFDRTHSSWNSSKNGINITNRKIICSSRT